MSSKKNQERTAIDFPPNLQICHTITLPAIIIGAEILTVPFPEKHNIHQQKICIYDKEHMKLCRYCPFPICATNSRSWNYSGYCATAL
jgi:hypothetical protein